MGKKFAPSYANIFMANWEEKALANCPKKPLHYLRYLDDIWGIWTHSEEEFQEFMAILNNQDPSIKLKHIINHETIDFLDTTVYKGPSFRLNGTLDIKVFFKETDTHALLFKTSFHPKHIFRGLIKSQLLRFYRICTQQKDFWTAVKILFTVLRKRGYCRTFLRQCLKTFKEQKPKQIKHMIPFISYFSKTNTILNRQIKINFNSYLSKLEIFKNHQLISAYRRHKNLKDILVRAQITSLQESQPKLEEFCSLKYIENKITKTIFKIDQKFTPHTKNCIYLIFCTKCNKQYIGETKNTIMTRLWQHRYNIRNKKETNTPLVRHFISHGLEALRVAVIHNNSSWTDKDRKAFERRWIYWLRTKEPFGLNLKYN